MGLLSVAVLLGALDAAALDVEPLVFHGYRSSKQWLPREHVITGPTGQELVAEKDLPEAFDWRDVDGVSYVTSSWNQHIPQYCGACWIHGTLSALNDRVKVARKAQFPDMRFGRQAINNCVPDPRGGQHPPPGCNGGDSIMIHKYLHTNPMPDDTCLPYEAKNMGCKADTICRNCFPNGTCWAVPSYAKFGVSQYGNVSGEVAMMKEIKARGPIACSFAAPDEFMNHYGEIAEKNEGVFAIDKNLTVADIDHVMEVAGWGQTASGQKYWVIRNSWGSYWGMYGWAYLKRGVNMMQVEYECDWAVPTYDDLDQILEGKMMGDYVHGDYVVKEEVAAAEVLPATRLGAKAAAVASSRPTELTSGAATASEASAPSTQLLAADAFVGQVGSHDAFVFVMGVVVALGVVRITGRTAVRQPELLG